MYLTQLTEARGQLCPDSLRVALRVLCFYLLALERELLVLGFLGQDLSFARQDVDFFLHLLYGEPRFLGEPLQPVFLRLELVVHFREFLDLLLYFYRLDAQPF